MDVHHPAGVDVRLLFVELVSVHPRSEMRDSLELKVIAFIAIAMGVIAEVVLRYGGSFLRWLIGG